MDKDQRKEQDAWECTEGIEHNLTKIGVAGKAYYDASLVKIQRNKALIVAAKFENRQLRAALNALREKERCSFGASDLKQISDRVKSLRNAYDEQREVIFAKELQLEQQLTNTQAAETDCEGVNDTNTPQCKRIRSLESKLETIMQKIKDAQSLKNNYESMLKPITDSGILNNFQMDSLGRTSRRREEELSQILLMYYDAVRAHNKSKNDLEQLLRSNFLPGVQYHRQFLEPKQEANVEIMKGVHNEVPKILAALSFPNAKELFHYIIVLLRRTDYLNQLVKELTELVGEQKAAKLSAKCLHEKVIKMRKKLLGKADDDKPKMRFGLGTTLRNMLEGTKRLMGKLQQLDSRGRASSLISIIRGTKRLVDKIHEGEMYNPEDDNVKKVLQQCELKLVAWLKGLKQWLLEKKAEKRDQGEVNLNLEALASITEGVRDISE